MVFVISSQFLPVLAISFSIGTENSVYSSVFSPKQVNCPSIFSATFFIMKW